MTDEELVASAPKDPEVWATAVRVMGESSAKEISDHLLQYLEITRRVETPPKSPAHHHSQQLFRAMLERAATLLALTDDTEYRRIQEQLHSLRQQIRNGGRDIRPSNVTR